MEPHHADVAGAIAWFIRQKHGPAWRHTRETARATLALTKYLDAQNEPFRPIEFAVYQGEKPILQDTIGVIDSTLMRTYDLSDAVLSGGDNQFEIIA